MKQIKIYTTTNCSSCAAVKRFFDNKKWTFEEINIEKENIDRDQLKQLTKGSTVPQIVIDGSSIGGYEDLLRVYG
ncbi:MAG: glutaredoxin family protein [Fidelibacterota bacterium]|jgi:glutaredoxin|tara:strand:+ start:325 stop:549 length:225 start_codon:yes stop_codon:yes gene_type:complete